ncbi:MAG TPA: metalloregulator ArsR/SmtB family transcription factor [Gaiellaceae bacterium]|nr:metalloregulator ArsR/SmtB family transcription factor [Gaiellaceae bacterium]
MNQALVRQLKALAHPIRLGMMQRLAQEDEICACDLGDAFAVSQPTVSEHLRVLREAGLVKTRRQGTAICYASVPEALAGLVPLIASLQPKARARAA